MTPLPAPETDIEINEGPLEYESDGHDLDDMPEAFEEETVLEPEAFKEETILELEASSCLKRSTTKSDVKYKDLHKGKVTRDLMTGRLQPGFAAVHTFAPRVTEYSLSIFTVIHLTFSDWNPLAYKQARMLAFDKQFNELQSQDTWIPEGVG